MTDDEVRRVLQVTGKNVDGFRDHVILSLALGAGLREFEITALDVGDVMTQEGGIRKVLIVRRFKNSNRKGAAPAKPQRVHLPESTYYKLQKYARKEKLGKLYRSAPFFWSRKGNRLSDRAVRAMFRRWQLLAGIDPPHNFHRLRHTAITIVRRRTKDMRITQRFARHASMESTLIYEHAADEEIAAAVRNMPV